MTTQPPPLFFNIVLLPRPLLNDVDLGAAPLVVPDPPAMPRATVPNFTGVRIDRDLALPTRLADVRHRFQHVLGLGAVDADGERFAF